MAEQNDQTLSFSERCGQFLTQHRKPIVIILGAICAVVAIALIVSALTIRSAKNASVETEAIISEWTDLRNKNAEDMAAKEDVQQMVILMPHSEHTQRLEKFIHSARIGKRHSVLIKKQERHCPKLIPPVSPTLMQQPVPTNYNSMTRHWNCTPYRRVTTTFRLNRERCLISVGLKKALPIRIKP